MTNRSNFSIWFAFIVLLFLFTGLGYAGYHFYEHRAEPVSSIIGQPLQEEVYLADERARPSKSFSLAEMPSWLFLHVSVIAAFQVLSVLAAAFRARRREFSRRDLAVIQFLIEIPMYLGLFGTLLGVCMTQFAAGTLVAPLAYITTMSGILLHVFGKLTIWLALASDSHVND